MQERVRTKNSRMNKFVFVNWAIVWQHRTCFDLVCWYSVCTNTNDVSMRERTHVIEFYSGNSRRHYQVHYRSELITRKCALIVPTLFNIMSTADLTWCSIAQLANRDQHSAKRTRWLVTVMHIRVMGVMLLPEQNLYMCRSTCLLISFILRLFVQILWIILFFSLHLYFFFKISLFKDIL